MGNCQAAEAATVVIHYPGGRVERLYWATSAAEVMRSNPGHYVALVTLCVAEEAAGGGEAAARRPRAPAVRLTRVKLLKPRDTLLLGHVYRLIASQEVTKALQARKEEKTRMTQQKPLDAKQSDQQPLDGSLDQLAHQYRDGYRGTTTTTPSGGRHRHWRPSLHSIAESSGSSVINQ